MIAVSNVSKKGPCLCFLFFFLGGGLPLLFPSFFLKSRLARRSDMDRVSCQSPSLVKHPQNQLVHQSLPNMLIFSF